MIQKMKKHILVFSLLVALAVCDCSDSCKTCSNSVCLACNSGYYLSNGVCQQCADLYCKNCSSTICFSCQDGHYLYQYQCHGCMKRCDSCNNSQTCNSCSKFSIYTHYDIPNQFRFPPYVCQQNSFAIIWIICGPILGVILIVAIFVYCKKRIQENKRVIRPEVPRVEAEAGTGTVTRLQTPANVQTLGRQEKRKAREEQIRLESERKKAQEIKRNQIIKKALEKREELRKKQALKLQQDQRRLKKQRKQLQILASSLSTKRIMHQNLEWRDYQGRGFNLNEEPCPICLDPNDEVQTNCQHLLHLKCAKAWHAKNTSCPLCRQKVTDLKIICMNCKKRCKSIKLETMAKQEKQRCDKCAAVTYH